MGNIRLKRKKERKKVCATGAGEKTKPGQRGLFSPPVSDSKCKAYMHQQISIVLAVATEILTNDFLLTMRALQLENGTNARFCLDMT